MSSRRASESCPLAALHYHHERGDFVKWVKAALYDDVLANHLDKLRRRELQGETLRDALVQRVRDRYAEVHEMIVRGVHQTV